MSCKFIMRYVKIIVVFALIYAAYIGFSKFMDTSVNVAKKVIEIEDLENTNKVNLLTKHIDDCSFKKELAEMNSNAMYKCILVDAEVKNEKIVRVLKELEVLEK